MGLQLPQYFVPVQLSDQNQIRDIFRQANYRISEYSFTNIYIWRDHYQFRWTIYEDVFYLIATSLTQELHAFPPICLKTPKWEQAFQYLFEISQTNQIPLAIIRFPSSLVKEVEAKITPQFQMTVQDDRANWDYIYLREDLAALSGKDYANFRKVMNKFLNSNEWRYQQITVEIRDQILELQEEWCDMHACAENESLSKEDQGIHEILEHWDQLSLFGGVLFIKENDTEKIVGFTIAETINSDTAVIHVEKADTAFRGVYETLVNQFNSHITSDMIYINREQDLGVENLRRAKERYHPHHLLHKNIVHIKKRNRS